jgi:hypothetical protein
MSGELEPDAWDLLGRDSESDLLVLKKREGACLYSIALSLKRIADALTDEEGIGKKLGADFIESIIHTSANCYGENIVEGMQNSIERGLRGINTNR